MTLLYMHELS